MRYIVEIPDAIHQRVLQLIADGEYPTMQDFLITSIQNQLQLETSASNKTDLITLSNLQDESNLIDSESKWTLDRIQLDRIDTVEHRTIEKREWIFGQVNRILPIKFGLRVLMAMLEQSGPTIPLSWFHERAANEARTFGFKLESIDDRKDKARGERLSVGFPIGQLSKSTDRYKTHFLGTLQSTTNNPIGALSNLNLALITREIDGEMAIGITEGGLKFGALENPILDTNNHEKSFSQEETNSYVDHIVKFAPNEASAMHTLLSMLDEGLNTPDTVDQRLEIQFPNWSSSQRATNRSGVLGRASDLNLLRREQKGQSVAYFLTKLGKDMLPQMGVKA